MSVKAERWLFLLATLPGVVFLVLPFGTVLFDNSPHTPLQELIKLVRWRESAWLIYAASVGLCAPLAIVLMDAWQLIGKSVHRAVLVSLCVLAIAALACTAIEVALIPLTSTVLHELWTWDFLYLSIVGLIAAGWLLLTIGGRRRGMPLQATTEIALMGPFVTLFFGIVWVLGLFPSSLTGSYVGLVTALAFLIRTVALRRGHIR